MIWLTADLHIGDPRLHLFPRPFPSAEHAAEQMVENWNSVITDNDAVVYVVGDFCIGQIKWLKYAERLNGQKILLKGNYDTFPNEEYIDHGFVDIIDDNLHLSIDDPESNRKLNLNIVHYPTKSVADRFNVVGHIHGAWRVQKNMLNVGVDSNNYYPVSLDDVFFFYNAIINFYDQDVWCHNHPANAAHEGRGKEGTYWEREFAGSLTA